jgi:hypothetical protein
VVAVGEVERSAFDGEQFHLAEAVPAKKPVVTS